MMNCILTLSKGTRFSHQHLVAMRDGFLKSAYSRMTLLGSSSSVPLLISRGFADKDRETKCARNVNIIEASLMPQFGCLSHLTHTQDTMMARCRTVNKVNILFCSLYQMS
ncbi:uncharacterized protein LOC123513297 [Portunus trituberculatus]|uniref:uncharacterized protein LOC123513297 n=1 Tax=Portunus trituberculatus TaxID=210409 RepID=UPI001E1CE205|nr:uncharacterized protein LOC123513297 [Portunus trituberculatus]